MDNDRDGRLGEAWRAHRAHLINVAFRILGDIGAAEDAVQEAFSRLLGTSPSAIDDERGWLIVVTSRICLDQMRSARSRLSQPVPLERFELTSGGATVDPADRVSLDDNVREALHVVLQQLSPAERVAFVMHDVFQIPFDTIAETVGRPASSCRQLAARARRRIAEASDTRQFGVEPTEERVVSEEFIGACATGDMARLLAVLDPQVSGDGNFGPDLPAPGLATGAPTVARRTLRFLGHGAILVSHPSSDAPALLAFVNRRLLAVLGLTIVDARITHLHADGDPATLEAVAADLAALR
jgi:RNA polymerase sigma-70 factor (ECF subfamily)